jgi:hypothetical protein
VTLRLRRCTLRNVAAIMHTETLALLCALALPSSALANDGVMGGAGADLIPMKTAEVSMMSEDIQLTYDADYWHVEADYVFLNSAAKEVALQLGFPEYRCEEDEIDCVAARSFHFEDMTTTVRGAPVRHRKGRVKGQHAWAPKLGNVWLFDMKLAAGEEVQVRHTYRLPASYDSSGGRSTRYVTRTGAQWAGPIRHARFRIRIPLQAVDFIGPDQLQRTSVATIVVAERKLTEVLYEVRDFSPEYDLSFYFIERHGVGSLDQEKPDLAPAGPEHAGLAESERCEDFLSIWELGHRAAFENVRDASSRLRDALKGGINSRPICEATVYAKYGKRFDDDRLNRYFYGPSGFSVGEWPYGFMKPNPDYDPSWLKPDDLATLELIRQLPDHALVDATPVAKAPRTTPAGVATRASAPPPESKSSENFGCSTVAARRVRASSGEPITLAATLQVILLLLRSRPRRMSRLRP